MFNGEENVPGSGFWALMPGLPAARLYASCLSAPGSGLSKRVGSLGEEAAELGEARSGRAACVEGADVRTAAPPCSTASSLAPWLPGRSLASNLPCLPCLPDTRATREPELPELESRGS